MKTIDSFSLNYEKQYPEHNTADNQKNLQKELFSKPLKFSFIKDIADPHSHQIFYQPNFRLITFMTVLFWG